MMSRERELLKRWLIDFGKIHPDVGVIKETKELLAQPEQEPVAWMWDEMFCDDWTIVSSVIKPSKSKYVANVRPLYLAPPKREPLSEEESYHEAKRLYEAEDGLWYADGFVDGLKFAEKMHGIGGEE